MEEKTSKTEAAKLLGAIGGRRSVVVRMGGMTKKQRAAYMYRVVWGKKKNLKKT